MKGELSYRQTLALAEAMYQHIKHGDEAHQRWLREQSYRFCLQHFSWSTGEPDDVFERAVTLGIKTDA